jgi:alpha-glucuronidase
MTADAVPLDRDGRIIEKVAKQLGMLFEVDEPHHYLMDAFELYGPQHEDSVKGKWGLYVGSVIPGVWRTANGDGWPDDYDVALLDHFEFLQGALQRVAHLYVVDLVDSVICAEDEAELYAPESVEQGAIDAPS